MGIAVGQLTLAFAVIACTIVHVHLAQFTPRSDGIKNSIRAEGEMSDLSMQMLYNGHDVNEHDTQLLAVTAATALQAKRDRRVLLVPPQFSHRISRRQAETTGNRGTQVKRDTLISKVAIENRNAVLLIDNNDDQTDSSNFPQISGQSSENAAESNDLSQQTQPSDFFELHDDSSAESLQSQIRRGALAMTDSGSEGKAEEPDDQNKVETKKMETIKEKIIEEIDQPTDQSDSLEQKPNDSKADDSNKDESQNSQTIGALPSSSVEADDKAATRRKRDVSADWQFDNGLPHSGYIQTLQHSSQIQRQIEPLTPNDTIFPMLEQQQQPYSQQEFYVVEHFPAPQQQDQRQNQQHNQQQNQQQQSQQQPHQLSPYLKPQEASWTSKLQQQLLPQQQRQQQQQQEQQQWLASKDDKSIREELANIRKDLSDIWLATVLTAELEMARQSAILTAKSQIIEFGNNSDEDNMIVEQQKHARHGRKKLSTHEHSNGRPSIGGWLPVALIKASPTPSPIPAPIPLPIPSPSKPFLVPAPNDSTDSAEEDNGWKFVSKKSSPTSETPRRKVSVAPWRSVPSGQMRSVRSEPKSIGKHKKLLNAQLIEDEEDEIQPKIWRRRQLPATIQSETREFFDKDIDKTDFISTGAGHVPSDNKEDGGNTVIAITDKVMIPQDPQVQDAQGQPSNIEPLPFPSEGQKPLKA